MSYKILLWRNGADIENLVVLLKKDFSTIYNLSYRQSLNTHIGSQAHLNTYMYNFECTNNNNLFKKLSDFYNIIIFSISECTI